MFRFVVAVCVAVGSAIPAMAANMAVLAAPVIDSAVLPEPATGAILLMGLIFFGIAHRGRSSLPQVSA